MYDKQYKWLYMYAMCLLYFHGCLCWHISNNLNARTYFRHCTSTGHVGWESSKTKVSASLAIGCLTRSAQIVQYYIFSGVVVEQNDRSVRLKCCCESLFSSVKHVKSKNCSIHTWKSMHSRCAFKAESPRGHKFWAACRCRQRGPRGPPWTWVDDHYLHHTYQSDPANPMNTWTWKVWIGL